MTLTKLRNEGVKIEIKTPSYQSADHTKYET